MQITNKIKFKKKKKKKNLPQKYSQLHAPALYYVYGWDPLKLLVDAFEISRLTY